MKIDALIELASKHSQQPSSPFIIPKDWSQGRTVFGGISAAMLYRAAREYVTADRLIRSITTNFVGPLIYDEAFTIQVEVLREGKNVSQVLARAVQDDKNCVIAQCCFGKPRESRISVKNTDTHDLELPTKAQFIPNIPKVTPKFLQHFDLSISSGGLPFTGRKSSHYDGWMRCNDAEKQISEAHVIAMIDAWPPTLIQQLRWPAPASTVSWNLEFIYPHSKLMPNDWFAYKNHTRQAADGYGHAEATIWDMHGKAIALSRQTVAVFD